MICLNNKIELDSQFFMFDYDGFATIIRIYLLITLISNFLIGIVNLLMQGPNLPNQNNQEVQKKDRKKVKKQTANVQFDEESRKSFLLGLKNKKKRKEKKAKAAAKEALRKARADLRNEKKEQQDAVVNQIITRQIQLGIKPLSIFLEGSGDTEMQVIQIDPKKNIKQEKEVKEEEEEEDEEE